MGNTWESKLFLSYFSSTVDSIEPKFHFSQCFRSVSFSIRGETEKKKKLKKGRMKEREKEIKKKIFEMLFPAESQNAFYLLTYGLLDNPPILLVSSEFSQFCFFAFFSYLKNIELLWIWCIRVFWEAKEVPDRDECLRANTILQAFCCFTVWCNMLALRKYSSEMKLHFIKSQLEVYISLQNI